MFGQGYWIYKNQYNAAHTPGICRKQLFWFPFPSYVITYH